MWKISTSRDKTGAPIPLRSGERQWESASLNDARLNDARLNMTAAPGMRDLAQRLLTYEAVESKTSEPMEFATLRVYEKLRQSLSAIAGVAAFELIAFRALTQAKSEAPGLWAAQVAADGSLNLRATWTAV